MVLKVGDRIKAKKPHACGGKEWEVMRTGADVKLKCATCGRTVFLSVPDAERIVAVRYPADKGETDG